MFLHAAVSSAGILVSFPVRFAFVFYFVIMQEKKSELFHIGVEIVAFVYSTFICHCTGNILLSAFKKFYLF